MHLLNDGRPCEIDNPDVSITAWWILRTAGPDDDEMGYTTKAVSDERVKFLLDYFDGLEVVR